MSRLWDTEPELVPFCSPEEARMVRQGLFVDQGAILLPKLRQRLDAWRAQLPKPTRDQMLQVTHSENRMRVMSREDDTQFWEALEADWRRKQKPDFVPIQSDDSWSPDMRAWLETERHEGRIYKDCDEANSAYTRTNPPDGTASEVADPHDGSSKGNPTPLISQPKQLTVFLCHSSEDKGDVRTLYHRLIEDGVVPWLDEEDLLPGQDWNMEIRRAVRSSHVVIVCLSKQSITKAGYVQKEIKEALDVADEQPDGTIFIIPLRLEECDVPDRLQRWHWVDYFEPNGHDRLLRALRKRAETLGVGLPSRSRDLPVPQQSSPFERTPGEMFAGPPTPSPQRAAKKLSDALARAQRNRQAESAKEDLEARFAGSARLKGPEEFQKMEQIFQEKAYEFNRSNKPDTVPDVSYDSRRHLLDGKKFGVSIGILIGKVYELRIFVGYHPDAGQFMAELPEVEVTRWRLRASEDDSGFFWHEMNEDARFSSEEIVDASIDALTDLLAADM